MSAEGISGRPQWDGHSVLMLRTMASGHEVVRLQLDGKIVSRHAKPFSASLVRAHPHQPALLFSSPQQEGLWLMDTTTGESHRLPVNIRNVYWAMWDITPRSLVYVQPISKGSGDSEANYLTQAPWEDVAKSQSILLPGMELTSNDRLVWQARNHQVWIIAVDNYYTQIRMARLRQGSGEVYF